MHLTHYRSPYFYQLLHALGVLDGTAAPTVRAQCDQRQLSVQQLVDRCGIQAQPVRELLVDYLRERQVNLDHVTLVRLADTLGRLFWRDLELHHPGIDSLRLAPAIAAGWKTRIGMKTTRRRQPDGTVTEVHSPRRRATSCLATVRAFYLDIAQWATDDPARWAPWAVPSPIRAAEIPHRKEADRRKSRMDQRTRNASRCYRPDRRGRGPTRGGRAVPGRRGDHRARPGLHRGRADPAPGGPAGLQAICDRLGPGAIEVFFQRWMGRLPLPLTPTDREGGYWWGVSMRHIEVCRTIVFDAPRHARGFFEALVIDNLEIGRPENIELIFRGHRAGRGRPPVVEQTFKTKVVTRDTVGLTINAFFKNSRIKQYLKDGRALRVETVINKPNDLLCHRRLEHLDELQAKGRAINARLLDTERVGQGCVLASPAFERVAQSTVTDDGRRSPALRFGDPRVMALLGALCVALNSLGFTNRSLRAQVSQLRGVPTAEYTVNQMSYDLARLHRKGLIARRPKSNTYDLTADGQRVAIFYTKVHNRLLGPGCEAACVVPADGVRARVGDPRGVPLSVLSRCCSAPSASSSTVSSASSKSWGFNESLLATAWASSRGLWGALSRTPGCASGLDRAPAHGPGHLTSAAAPALHIGNLRVVAAWLFRK
ncbi:MAG: hypothetical protein L0H79_05230 [Intrasporangium sp.]|uniref:hypothetical protein n=1 Tax=Intrasporangium sp. TaxID=1925024 RepID=UPI0026486229|nr:hypothetical protein [Intrasporangium sp.]MDN5795138.1 hypothetical protein [Intrasporangium sp.]